MQAVCKLCFQIGYNQECPETSDLNFHIHSEFSDCDVCQAKI